MPTPIDTGSILVSSYFEKLHRLEERGFREFQLDLEDRQFKPAAVLLLLWPEGDDWRVLFTQRPQTMNSHSGQISFPGGKADPSDTDLVHTALRETFEEVGVPLDRERVVGRLDDAWSVSRRLVYPYVAVSESEPSFTPNPAEVSRLLVGELSNLLEPDALQTRKLSFEGIEFIDQTYTVEGETVWGLTADILTEFLDWLRDSPEPGHRAHKREEELVAFLQRFPKDGSMDRGNS